MRKIILAVLAVGMLTASGCIDATQVVELKADGSGRVVETVYLSPMALGMMGGMMAMGAGDGQPAAPANPLMDKEEAQEKASNMGEGVTLVSIREVKKADGSKGAQSIYSFKDISKIKLSMSDTMEMGEGGADPEEEPEEPITFAYAKGNLTINLPQPEADAAAAAEEAPPADPQQAAMAQQMMQMFRGMRMRVLVKTPSEIKSTNAKHVNLAPDTKKKQYITLISMDMDKILAKPEGMQKMMKMQGNDDPAAAMKMLEGIDGVKIETSEKISVKF